MGVRDYPKGSRVYLDMDGVIADFEGWCSKMNSHPSIAKLHPEAYLSLNPLAGALDAVNSLLAQFPGRVFVLTKIPSKNLHAATQKLLWIQQHLPSMRDHVIITPDKGCVGRHGDVLVDDHPEWANALTFPGAIVTFGEDSHALTWSLLLPWLVSFLSRSEPGV